ncbi:hypothetical protein OEZ85_004068 [Tetradesmus obliquus]|uniref:Uncharacterized protein n=1 Tax=Tetradesmus obliquus TaxID=3088 RepID=A0ABY8UDL4_TETOB|nr:hypothetical protein OEZ85_004068 [Tetradesmus obliquus]
MASFLQGVKNFFFGKTEEEDQEEQQAAGQPRESGHKRARSSSKHKGHQPVLQDAGFSANGGVQGLNWYTAALQLDGDGDAAHAFYQEQQQPQPGSSSQLQQVQATKQHGRQHCKLQGVRQGHVVLSGAR